MTIDGKLETLRKREQALRAAIAEEKVRRQKRAERDRARTASILGECVLGDLETHPQLGPLIEESLKRNASPRDTEFLKAQGWKI